jgi:hypothetical protein
MDVVVYRKAKVVTGSRLVCTQPVFKKGKSATDQSLNVAGRVMIVENNYGYSGPSATEEGRTTTPGLERVDLNRDLHGCHRVWSSNEIAPTVVPKISLANGLVYTYTKPPASDGSDYWFLTALDFRTGRRVYRFRAGEGLGYNNNYAPITIGPDNGAIYLGVLGGMVVLRDATPPPRPSTRPKGAPRLVLGLKYTRRSGWHSGTSEARPCTTGPVRATVSGRDAHLIATVAFLLDGTRVARDASPPYTAEIQLPRGTSDRVHTIGARAHLVDGRTRTLHSRVRACAGGRRH